MRLYLTFEEDEAYGDGKRDGARGRFDMMRMPNMFAEHDTPDKAYWEGYQEVQRNKKRNDEEYEREDW
jgi:hypothetical protein